jgi:uncharacterized protein
MGETKPPRVVSCPTCGKPVPWVAQSAFRPFCSERCRQIDLGAWAAEEYRVPEIRPVTDSETDVSAGDGQRAADGKR